MNFVQGDVVGLALDLAVIGLSGNYGYTYQGGNCFPAGTPLLTPTGDKAIEKFRVGDQVLSRSELDLNGELESKVVEEVFVRTARIVRLRVCGHEIATTAEHPFWVKGKGWQKVSELRPGDLLSSHDGQWVALEGVWDTGEEATVYNLRIAEYHSYFVGARDWGFSVWAHNASYHLNSNDAVGHFGIYEIRVNGGLYKIGKADLSRVTKSSGLPTRLHQQVRKLRKIYGEENVVGKVVQDLGQTTTQAAKAAETVALQLFYDLFGFVPEGNIRSFFPQ